MFSLIVAVLWALVAIALLVGLYYVALWVFAQLGIPVPAMAVKVTMVIICLLIIIWLVTAVHSGHPMVPSW